MSHSEPIRALHFGSGNLGRGLVVPVLANAGVEVAVADVDTELIDRLRVAREYPLEVVELDGSITEQRTAIADAFHVVRDKPKLEQWLDGATIITTSVQFENLPHVANTMRDTVIRRVQSGEPFFIMACENVEGSSTHLAALMELQAVATDEQLRRTFLDTVVDRNSQALWPASLSTRTEAYWEWAITSPPGVEFPVSSLTQVSDIAPSFWRKRYLVNTVADSLAFLGYIRGHAYLHEAFQDTVLLTWLEPLFTELRQVLEYEYGFSADELRAYQDRAIRRLQTPGINRQIGTVARGAWRKLGPDERFLRPVRTLYAMGEAGAGVARAIAAVLWVAKDLDPSASYNPDDVLSEVRELWRGEPWSEPFQAVLLNELALLKQTIGRLTR